MCGGGEIDLIIGGYVVSKGVFQVYHFIVLRVQVSIKPYWWNKNELNLSNLSDISNGAAFASVQEILFKKKRIAFNE